MNFAYNEDPIQAVKDSSQLTGVLETFHHMLSVLLYIGNND